MPTLLKSHFYRNRSPKINRYINTIIPQADREVPQRLFDCFEDITELPPVRLDDDNHRSALRDILETTGANQ